MYYPIMDYIYFDLNSKSNVFQHHNQKDQFLTAIFFPNRNGIAGHGRVGQGMTHMPSPNQYTTELIPFRAS